MNPQEGIILLGEFIGMTASVIFFVSWAMAHK
jgi:hypothetical protein